MFDGIWNERWDEGGVPFGRWPHERPSKKSHGSDEVKKERRPVQQLGTAGLEAARRLRTPQADPAS